MVPSEQTTWFRTLQRRRVAAIVGLFLVLELLYLASGPPGERALAVFVLAPLIVGAFGVWQTTAWTAVAALAVTFGTWWWTSPVSGSALVGRMVVVAIGGATAVLAARTRERLYGEAIDLRVAMERSNAFVGQLVPEPVRLRDVAVTVHYEPGEAGLLVGGDFIDVAELPDGSAAFVIGDVCGHGPGPAALGVALRTTWRALVRVLPADPARWLQELEDAFADELARGFATASTGILAADGQHAVVSSAGHPYPITIGSQAILHRLDNDPPLGLRRSDEARADHQLVLDGRALLLFTDGLWESQRAADDGTRVSIDAVVEAIDARGWSGGRASVDQLVEHFRPSDGAFEDDVGILLLEPLTSR